MRFISVAIVICFISSCGMLPQRPRDCAIGDWYNIGYYDGLYGMPKSHLYDRRISCVKRKGVKPNIQAYTAGHQLGLKEYCTADTGYQAGQAGKPYYDVCTGDAADAFKSAYQKGQKISQISQIKDELQAEKEQLESNITTEKKKKLIIKEQGRVRDLEREEQRLGSIIETLERPYHLDEYDY